ncbi:hypothetical protein [Provencibacterium massiliense]|uniref:hypothetical protein n=1 Tax=Provencibacterium massiliense TaxID=1841868 RepID=UPI0009A59C24|nr:hypothetical protein [Provencibacterium massiliense]RGB65034.1 hypothetical protein DW086_11250 [Harryflintia acetispora]
MKHLIGAALAACLLALAALPAAAQEGALRLTAQAGSAQRQYGFHVALDPASTRTKDYTYELLEGERVVASREHVADAACFLPIENIDAANPGTYTVRVTAYPSGERAGFDSTASVRQEASAAKGCSCATADRFQIGSGTEADPYLVGTLGQLLHINQHAAQKCYYMQTADIIFGDHTYSQQKNEEVKLGAGSVYDGNGHVIRDGSVRCTAANSSAAIFGVKGSTLRNLGFEELSFSGTNGAGPVSGDTTSVVEYCYGKDIDASANNHASPLVHWAEGRIENCYTVGGQLTTTKDESYGAGGITGCMSYSSQIDKTYAMPAKLTSPKPAGIAAYIRSGTVGNSFYLKGVASYGSLPSGDNTNAAPLELSQFADQSRFEAAGWDFENVWVMGEVSYTDASGNAVTATAPVLRVFQGG